MLLEQGGVIDDDEVHGLGGADGGGTGAVADQLDLPKNSQDPRVITCAPCSETSTVPVCH